MKKLGLYFVLFLAACNDNSTTENVERKDSSVTTTKEEAVPVTQDSSDIEKVPAKLYANERFKDVRVEKVGEDRYRISGKGQIFEASFGWVIEDGHNELAEGFESTNAGAPEWGTFDFTVEAKKARPNSTLHLILFESSARDGSRQYELPLLLN